MKIIYIHQYFSTPFGSTGTRSYYFASKLVEAGFKVDLICLNDSRTSSGLSNEFKNNVRNGFVNGINVIEFNINYSNHLNFKKRILIFILFTFHSIKYVIFNKADLIIASSTPITVALPGIIAKIIKKTPFIFEVRDLWPEIPIQLGIIKNKIFIGFIKFLEIKAYTYADKCIGLAPGICDYINRSTNHIKAELIPNSCDIDLFKAPDHFKKKSNFLNNKKKFKAVFMGAHGICNGLEILIHTARILDLKGEKNIEIILIGEGMEKNKLIKLKKKFKLKNIKFINSMSKKKLAKYVHKNADVGLMILKNIPAFYEGTSPNKFFDYIASGLPVIINYPGWITKIVNKEKIGLSVSPNSPDKIVDALIYLKKNQAISRKFSLNSRNLAVKTFSRKNSAEKFLVVVKNLLSQANSFNNLSL